MTLLTRQEIDEYEAMIPLVGLDQRRKIQKLLELEHVGWRA